MIKKCDHVGCQKAGICRAPKNRTLKEYWYFCQEHAAEYNKNWNYYANMSAEEIEADWEEQTFGTKLKQDTSKNDDYINIIKDFLSGKSIFDTNTIKKSNLPANIVSALEIFQLPITASWTDISKQYRLLAKKYHPDTATNKQNSIDEFNKISTAYERLKKHFNKK